MSLKDEDRVGWKGLSESGREVFVDGMVQVLGMRMEKRLIELGFDNEGICEFWLAFGKKVIETSVRALEIEKLIDEVRAKGPAPKEEQS